MAIFKKKEVVESPESKVKGANVHVQAQKAQFNVIIDEVQYAISQRNDALEEMEQETELLRIALARQGKQMEYVLNENKIDKKYIERINQFIKEREW